jgi:hypothetical protein
MRNIVLVLLVLIFSADICAQTSTTLVSGKVSFVSPQNIYVKFSSTEGISAGDTLFIMLKDVPAPALIVNNKSSLSCICTPLSGIKLAVADNIVARARPPVKSEAAAGTNAKQTAVSVAAAEAGAAAVSAEKAVSSDGRKQMIRGSTSLSSYTDNSNTPGPNSQRWRYTLNIDAANIGDSRFSFESYFSFKYKAGEWDLVKSDIFSALKIYNLALRYSPDKTMQISLGRRINPRISNLGASDGLQIEKSFNHFSIGALIGSRPDYANYGFNFNLLQYGAYTAYSTKKADTYTETSLAFVNQTNNSKTDRRFLYFQHSNSVIRNLSFFSTFEVDLYKMMVDTAGKEHSQNTFDLTGLYLSLTYRFGRVLSISGSYDARKNVMYYETYKTYLDRILEDQMRQGYRAQATAHITRDLIFGAQAGYRFLKSDPHPSKNVYGYVTYTRIPGVEMSGTLSATWLESGYMTGNIYGASLSKDFFSGKVQTGVAYQYVNYNMPESLTKITQNIGELNFSWQIARKMFFSLYYEGTFEKQDKYNRLYLQIRKRF